MRPSFNVRLGLALSVALTLSALCALPADASPRSRHGVRASRSQVEHGSGRHVRAHGKVQRSGHRSTYYLLRAQRLVRWHIPERLEPRRTAPLHDTDAAALQSASVAVSGEDDLLVLASLEPLGILALPPCRLTVHAAATPRSPRGPPLFRA